MLVDFVEKLSYNFNIINISFRTENVKPDLLGSCLDFCLMNAR